MKKKIIVPIILGFIVVVASYGFGYQNGRKDVGLAEFHFKVVDAETGENFGRNFSYRFPGTDFTTILRSGQEFSVCYTITDTPITLQIGKDGYENQSFQIKPERTSASGGPLPLELKTIRLEPQK